ncbi:MAG TPA: hypothetical protein VGN34_34070 [Ktedonobacteraceae bacterium]
MNKTLLLAYLDVRRLPVAGNEEILRLHQAFCELAPEFYLNLLADPSSEVSHKREILTNVLQQASAHTIERKQIIAVLSRLPLTDALIVLDGIRTRKINGRRAHDLVLTFLLGHEQFATLAATRKHYVTRLIRHALGERTWSAARRALAERSTEGEALLQRELLRFSPESELARVREALSFLAGVTFTPAEPVLLKSQAARQDIEQGRGLPGETLLGLRGIYHRTVPLKRTLYLAAPRGDTARGDGPLTKLYKEAFQAASTQTAQPAQGLSAQPETSRESALAQLGRVVTAFLRQPLVAQQDQRSSAQHADQSSQSEMVPFDAQLREQLMREVHALPAVTGRLAIVLDLSASMLSSGERAYHPAALALALVRLLQERVSEIVVRQVGEPMFSLDVLPRPQSATDLATALLDVAAQKSELILLLTDGYENVRQGDTIQIVQGMRQLGLAMPICQVVPLFTLAEDLAQRRLGTAIPLIALEHERGVRELLARLLLVTTAEELSAEVEVQLHDLLLEEVIA